jgi:hypothetical protein
MDLIFQMGILEITLKLETLCFKERLFFFSLLVMLGFELSLVLTWQVLYYLSQVPS